MEVNGKTIIFSLPLEIPKERLVCNTPKVDFMSDFVVIPTEDGIKLLISFAAQKLLMAGAGLILGHQKVKKLLGKYFLSRNRIVMFCQGLDKPSPFVHNFALYMAEYAIAIHECEEGDAVRKAMIKLKVEHSSARQKPLVVLSLYDKKQQQDETKASDATDKELLKGMLEKHLGKQLSPIDELKFSQKDSWYHFYDSSLNVKYMFGSQLYSEYPDYDKTFNPVEKLEHRVTGRFDDFLAECVAGFARTSEYEGKVSIY